MTKALPLPKVWLLAAPSGVLAALGLPLAMFLPNFYIEQVGITPAAAALVFLLLRLWDGVTDPALGFASDSLNPPIGKRRFWVALSVPILMVSIWMAMVPSQSSGALYLAGWLMVLYVGVTALQVGLVSWTAELAHSYDERSRLMGWTEVFIVAGMILLLVLVASIETGRDAGQIDQGRWDVMRTMATVLIIALPLTAIPALLFVKEGIAKKPSDLNIGQALRSLRANKDLGTVLGANVLHRCASGFGGTLFLWYMSIVLDLPGFAAALIAAYFVFAFLGMPIWMALARRITKVAAFVIAVLAGAILSVPFAFLAPAGRGHDELMSVLGSPLDAYQLIGIVLAVLTGLTFGAGPFLTRSMMADVIDGERLATGQDRTGVFFALLSFSDKLGFAVAVGCATLMIGAIGIVPGGRPANDIASIEYLAWLYAGPPTILLILSAGVISKFTIDRSKEARTRAALTSRDAALAGGGKEN